MNNSIPLNSLCVASAIADCQSGCLLDYNERFEQLVLLFLRRGAGDANEEQQQQLQDDDDADHNNNNNQQHISNNNDETSKRRETHRTIWELLELDPCQDTCSTTPTTTTTKRIYQGDNLPSRWVRIHLQILVVDSHHHLLLIQVEDVDQQLRAQDHYTAILETSFDGFWDYHLQKDYEYMSPRFWSMFGYLPEEKPHHPSAWQDMIHPEDLKISLEALGAHVGSHGEIPYIQETRYKHKNGSWVWVLCRGRVIEWGDDNVTPVRMVGTHTDITEMKHKQLQERELHVQIEQEHKRVIAANEELKRFVQHVNAPVFGVDQHQMINAWNLRMQQITNIAAEDIVGTALSSSVVKNAAVVVQDALNEQEIANSLLEIDIPQTDKNITTTRSLKLLVNTTTRRGMDGTVLGCFCFGLDLTEIQLANEKLVQERERFAAEKELNAFIAHEVRNPLAAAMSATQFIRDELESGDEVSSQLSTRSSSSVLSDAHVVASSLDYIHQLLTSMLDLNKFLAGGLTLSPRPVYLKTDIVEPVYAMFRHMSDKMQLSYEIKEDCHVCVDDLRLKQVIVNLTANAFKFAQEGFVRIQAGRLDDSSDMIYIYVEDSGPGIPVDKRQLLFQRYVQLTKQAQGSGIGLFLTRHLVEAMNGSISIDETYESGFEDRPGTRFVVKIPLPEVVTACDESADAMAEQVPSDAPAANGPATTNGDKNDTKSEICFPSSMKMLIVDDDKIIRRILARRFQKLDKTMTVDEAESGEEAINKISSRDYDLILVDHFMPLCGGELTGEETIAAIRDSCKGVIIGSSGNDMRKEHCAAGADLFWQKPVPKDDVILEDLRKAFQSRGMLVR